MTLSSITWDDIKNIFTILGPLLLFASILLSYWKDVVRPQNQKKKEKTIQVLTNQLSQYKAIHEQIIYVLSVINSNNFEIKVITIGHIDDIIDTKISDKIEQCLSQYKLCSDLYEGYVAVVEKELTQFASQYAPENQTVVRNMFCDKELIREYLSQDEPSIFWFRQNHSDKYHQLIATKENEKNLDKFFEGLNHTIKVDRFITLLRKETQRLIEITNSTISDVTNEIKNTQDKFDLLNS